MTIHLVYPYDKNKIACPWEIGNQLGDYFKKKNLDVLQFDWINNNTTYPTSENDILIGHPCDIPGHIFLNSIDKNWHKRFILMPVTMTPYMIKRLDPIVKEIDGCFLISGPYWFDYLPNGWKEKSIRLDLGINISRFPLIKERFNPVGKRKFLYIGHSTFHKNPEYLAKISVRSRHEFAHMGNGLIYNFKTYGYVDFLKQEVLNIVKGYDFLISVGIYDANPTVVLEAMAWGLIPIATKESGWCSPPCISFPQNDLDLALKKIEELQNMPEDKLLEIQKTNRGLAENTYTWESFCSTIYKKITEEK